MKELLNAIKSELQSNLDYIRSGDVFVTEDAAMIPGHVKFPAIGLKDGDIVRRELAGSMWEVTFEVAVFAYVQLVRDGAAVMGDDASGKKGVLEIEDDVNEILDENLLDISGMQDAFSPGSSGSELFGNETDALQRKAIRYRYVKEESRP